MGIGLPPPQVWSLELRLAGLSSLVLPTAMGRPHPGPAWNWPQGSVWDSSQLQEGKEELKCERGVCVEKCSYTHWTAQLWSNQESATLGVLRKEPRPWKDAQLAPWTPSRSKHRRLLGYEQSIPLLLIWLSSVRLDSRLQHLKPGTFRKRQLHFTEQNLSTFWENRTIWVNSGSDMC